MRAETGQKHHSLVKAGAADFAAFAGVDAEPVVLAEIDETAAEIVGVDGIAHDSLSVHFGFENSFPWNQWTEV